MGHYNTTGESGDIRQQSIKKNEKQDAVILGIFQANPQHSLTPYDVWQLCTTAGYRYPQTSVRRSITDLTAAGKLTKSDTACGVGEYLKAVHKWQLAPAV